MTPLIKLSGPTSFATIINAGIDIVGKNNGQYHVLVIIADGQVTRNPTVPPGQLSPMEKATIEAIVTARHGFRLRTYMAQDLQVLQPDPFPMPSMSPANNDAHQTVLLISSKKELHSV